MKAKRQNITIKLKDGGTAEVPALVLGDIAIHKTWLTDGKVGKFYALTYVPTGTVCVYGFDHQRQARRVAERIADRFDLVDEADVVAAIIEERLRASNLS